MDSIELNDISFSYGEKVLFNNLNLQINKNKFIVIKGPSGVGKTTLLNIIGLIEFPQKGLLKINNQEVQISDVNKYKRNINYLLQSSILIEHLTVYENVILLCKWWEIEEKEIINKINKLTPVFKLENFMKQFPPNLSQGQRQRVALLITVITSPSLILLDEPLGSIDFDNKKLIIEEFKNLVKGKFTVVCVSHSNIFDKLADQIYFIKNFKLIN